ncbi:MAG: hypothetical protein AAF191_18675 [Verrucomicrobiota bacterium]
MTNAPTAAAPRIQPWSLWLVFGLMFGGVLVAFDYVKRNRAEAESPRPPYVSKIERDFTGTNHDGVTRQISELKGSLWLATHLHSLDDGRSAEVARLVDALRSEFGDYQLPAVSFAVDPDATPEDRAKFLADLQIDPTTWWFLEGTDATDQKRLLSRYLRFMPSRKLPAEKGGGYYHDVRVALIDEKANVRGYYQLLHPEHSEFEKNRLRKNLTYLLSGESDAPES